MPRERLFQFRRTGPPDGIGDLDGVFQSLLEPQSLAGDQLGEVFPATYSIAMKSSPPE
jgi:hypothetical protein